MEAPFKVGQRVVAIVDSKSGVFKKGDRFIIKGLRECACGTWQADVGIVFKNAIILRCADCKTEISKYGGIRWTQHYCFAPITETYTDITAEIAAGAEQTAERPDVRMIKEPVKN